VCLHEGLRRHSAVQVRKRDDKVHCDELDPQKPVRGGVVGHVVGVDDRECQGKGTAGWAGEIRVQGVHYDFFITIVLTQFFASQSWSGGAPAPKWSRRPFAYKIPLESAT
jgi:hypothetical protein